MSLPRFVIGMLFVVALITVWSVIDSVPVGTVLLRAVACAVFLQVGYFLAILVMVMRQSRKAVNADDNAPKKKERRQTKADDLTVGDPLSH